MKLFETVFLLFCPLNSLCLCPSGLFIVVILFLLVENLGKHKKINIISIVFGFVSCLGCTLLGNFQVTAQNILNYKIIKEILLFFLPIKLCPHQNLFFLCLSLSKQNSQTFTLQHLWCFSMVPSSSFGLSCFWFTEPIHFGANNILDQSWQCATSSKPLWSLQVSFLQSEMQCYISE